MQHLRAGGPRDVGAVVDGEQLAVSLDSIAACDLLIIWRADMTEDIRAAIKVARTAGAKVQFDVDDLMFEPAIARVELIDGIRSQGFSESGR